MNSSAPAVMTKVLIRDYFTKPVIYPSGFRNISSCNLLMEMSPIGDSGKRKTPSYPELGNDGFCSPNFLINVS